MLMSDFDPDSRPVRMRSELLSPRLEEAFRWAAECHEGQTRKMHNLVSIEVDLRAARPVWSQFNAAREQVLWYYATSIDACVQGDSRLEPLATACRNALDRVRRLD
jgi:hypothetical protein